MKKENRFSSHFKSLLTLLTLTVGTNFCLTTSPIFAEEMENNGSVDIEVMDTPEDMVNDEPEVDYSSDQVEASIESTNEPVITEENEDEVNEVNIDDNHEVDIDEEAEEIEDILTTEDPFQDSLEYIESGDKPAYGDKENPRKSDVTLDGIDISNWQSNINLDQIEADFIILKASGGKSFKDKSFDRFAKQTLASGRLLGFYHFASDFGHEGTPEEEADFFFQQVEPYIGKGIPILDYEQSDLLRSGSNWALRFLDRFYDLSGVKCMLYTSSYFSRSIDWKPVADAGYPLWVACYGKNEVQEGYRPTEETKTDGFGTGAFETYYMHQYSSKGRLEGFDGNLDMNKFYGSRADWQQLCVPAPLNRPMYRVYNYYTGEHFYTGSKSEYTELVRIGWKDEGVAWISPKSGKNVYRLVNPNNGDHHYTTDVNERDTLIEMGWQYEGVGWVSEDEENGHPIYRLYNPNAETGIHHYTTDKNEVRELISWGWVDEEIAWYGLDMEKAVQNIKDKADEPISLKQETQGLLSKY